jgi:hypothetical protein
MDFGGIKQTEYNMGNGTFSETKNLRLSLVFARPHGFLGLPHLSSSSSFRFRFRYFHSSR